MSAREERKLGETFAGPMASNPQECGTKPGGDLVPLFSGLTPRKMPRRRCSSRGSNKRLPILTKTGERKTGRSLIY